MEALPHIWETIVNMTFKKKEQIQPYQNKFADKTKIMVAVQSTDGGIDGFNQQIRDLANDLVPDSVRARWIQAPQPTPF